MPGRVLLSASDISQPQHTCSAATSGISIPAVKAFALCLTRTRAQYSCLDRRVGGQLPAVLYRWLLDLPAVPEAYILAA
jgi:hypothetical protein